MMNTAAVVAKRWIQSPAFSPGRPGRPADRLKPGHVGQHDARQPTGRGEHDAQDPVQGFSPDEGAFPPRAVLNAQGAGVHAQQHARGKGGGRQVQRPAEAGAAERRRRREPVRHELRDGAPLNRALASRREAAPGQPSERPREGARARPPPPAARQPPEPGGEQGGVDDQVPGQHAEEREGDDVQPSAAADLVGGYTQNKGQGRQSPADPGRPARASISLLQRRDPSRYAREGELRAPDEESLVGGPAAAAAIPVQPGGRRLAAILRGEQGPGGILHLHGSHEQQVSRLRLGQRLPRVQRAIRHGATERRRPPPGLMLKCLNARGVQR
jgi:hypothetical protein